MGLRRQYTNSPFEALNPTAGEPAGMELNSPGDVNGVGGASIDPVPDSFSAGAERTTCMPWNPFRLSSIKQTHKQSAYVVTGGSQALVERADVGLCPSVVVAEQDVDATRCRCSRGRDRHSRVAESPAKGREECSSLHDWGREY